MLKKKKAMGLYMLGELRLKRSGQPLPMLLSGSGGGRPATYHQPSCWQVGQTTYHDMRFSHRSFWWTTAMRLQMNVGW